MRVSWIVDSVSWSNVLLALFELWRVYWVKYRSTTSRLLQLIVPNFSIIIQKLMWTLGIVLNVLIPDVLNGFLPCFQFILVHFQLDSILSDAVSFVFQILSQLKKFFSETIFVTFEETDLLRVELVPFTLFFYFVSFSIEVFFLDTIFVNLLL